MFKKLSFLFFYINVLSSVCAFAGWPNDGWESVPSLTVTHAGTVIELNGIHQELATQEESLTRVLPSNDKTNIVLASITFVGENEGTTQEHIYRFKTLEEAWHVFESGSTSAFTDNPVGKEAQRRMKKYVPGLRTREGLTPEDELSLVQDCADIAEKQQYFNDIINHFRFFYDFEISTEDILERIERMLSSDSSDDPHHNVYEEFLKDRTAFSRVRVELELARNQGGDDISELTTGINEQGASSTNVAELMQLTKTLKNLLSKKEKALPAIRSKIIGTYWHSEQRFLKYVEENMESILKSLGLPFTPTIAFVNIHSRHDICRVCSHSIVRSLAQPGGALYTLETALSEEFGDLRFYITSSFRELRTNTNYVQRDTPVENLEGLDGLLPAFPTLQVQSVQ